MSARVGQQQQDMGRGARDGNIKRAPEHFEDDDDNVGDVDENVHGGPRGRPGVTSNFQTNTSENPNRGMHIDQRGTQKRGNSSKRQKSADKKKGNQMANKSYQSSEIGGDESHNGDPEFAKDFNSAYQKLVEKIYQEQGNTLLVSQEEIFKLEHTKQLNEEDFRQRVMEYHENKLRKIAQKQDEIKDKDLEGCTFQPELVTRSNQEQPTRNLDQFIQDQQKFLDKKNKKREDAKQQNALEETSIMHPTIDETSKRIVEEKLGDKRNKPTHERLYELNKELQQKKQMKLQEQIEQSKSQAEHSVPLSKRDKPLDQTLYDDAERRRTENARKKEELDRTRDLPKEKYFHNDTSDKYVQKKFERELQQLEQEMATEGGNEEQKEADGLLNYGRMCEALSYLGFLPRDKPNIEAIDQQLCQDLWKLTRGEDRGGISWDTLKVLTLNFIGIRTHDREKVNEEEEEKPELVADGDQPAENPSSANDVLKFGFFEENTFYIRKGDGKKIFTLFKNFYVHRMHHVGSTKRQTGQYGPEIHLLAKPQISNKSQKLAENHRRKVFGDKPITNSVEIFLQPKHNQSELDEKKRFLKEKQLEGCSFRPKTLDYDQGARTNQESAGNKNETLYMSKPKGWFKDKEFKSTQDLEFERHKEECTFKPTINDPSSLQALTEGDQDPVLLNVEQIRGVNKTMERLAKARQSQLEKKLMTERGMPSQLMASIGKQEASFSFGSNTNKFKTAFGKDGSQINNKRSRQTGFADSQKIDTQQLSTQKKKVVKRPPPQKPKAQTSRQQRQSQQEHQQQQEVHNEQEYYEEEQQQINIQQQHPMKRNSSKAASKNHLHQEQELIQSESNDYEEEGVHHQEDEQEEEEVDQHYQEPEEQYQEDTEQREGMNETDYEGQQFAGGQESSEQSPVKSNGDREPMLYVDVNLGGSGTQRIVVFEGDTAEGLAEKFSIEYKLDEGMREKLTLMLQQQIAGVLEKIEEVQSNNSDNQNLE